MQSVLYVHELPFAYNVTIESEMCPLERYEPAGECQFRYLVWVFSQWLSYTIAIYEAFLYPSFLVVGENYLVYGLFYILYENQFMQFI
jgi:hypothetical protein